MSDESASRFIVDIQSNEGLDGLRSAEIMPKMTKEERAHVSRNGWMTRSPISSRTVRLSKTLWTSTQCIGVLMGLRIAKYCQFFEEMTETSGLPTISPPSLIGIVSTPSLAVRVHVTICSTALAPVLDLRPASRKNLSCTGLRTWRR